MSDYYNLYIFVVNYCIILCINGDGGIGLNETIMTFMISGIP